MEQLTFNFDPPVFSHEGKELIAAGFKFYRTGKYGASNYPIDYYYKMSTQDFGLIYNDNWHTKMRIRTHSLEYNESNYISEIAIVIQEIRDLCGFKGKEVNYNLWTGSPSPTQG